MISDDGRYVAFTSAATTLAGNANGVQAVFVRDLVAGTTVLASGSWNGAPVNDGSFEPASSGDGRYVVFYTLATNLLAGDTNGVADLVVFDRLTGASDVASVSASGAAANGNNFRPGISPEGKVVVFSTSATNLVSGDTNAKDDVCVAPNPLW